MWNVLAIVITALAIASILTLMGSWHIQRNTSPTSAKHYRASTGVIASGVVLIAVFALAILRLLSLSDTDASVHTLGYIVILLLPAIGTALLVAHCLRHHRNWFTHAHSMLTHR